MAVQVHPPPLKQNLQMIEFFGQKLVLFQECTQLQLAHQEYKGHEGTLGVSQAARVWTHSTHSHATSIHCLKATPGYRRTRLPRPRCRQEA